MILALGGCAALAGVAIIFAALLPRDGRVPRFVGTVVEPWVAVAFTAGFSLALAMIIGGVATLLGG